VVVEEVLEGEGEEDEDHREEDEETDGGSQGLWRRERVTESHNRHNLRTQTKEGGGHKPGEEDEETDGDARVCCAGKVTLLQ